MLLGQGGGTYRAGSETSSVQICGVSGFDLAELLSKIIVFGLQFLGQHFMSHKDPRRSWRVQVRSGRAAGRSRMEREGVLGESVKCMQFVNTLFREVNFKVHVEYFGDNPCRVSIVFLCVL